MALIILAGHAAGCGAARRDPVEAGLETACRNIDRVIADPVRAARLRQLIGQIGDLARERNAASEAYRAAWRALNADYDAPAEAFSRLEEAHEARRRVQRERFLDLQERFAAAVDDGEWKRLDDAHPAALLPHLIEPPEAE